MKKRIPTPEPPRLQQKHVDFDLGPSMTLADIICWAETHNINFEQVEISGFTGGYEDATLQASYVRTETEEEYEVRIENARREAQREAEERDRHRAEDQRNNEIRKLEAQIKKLKGL